MYVLVLGMIIGMLQVCFAVSGRGLPPAQSPTPLTVRLSLQSSVLLACTICRHSLKNETNPNSMGTILCVSNLISWCLSKFLVLIRAVLKVIDISLHCSIKYLSQGHYLFFARVLELS